MRGRDRSVLRGAMAALALLAFRPLIEAQSKLVTVDALAKIPLSFEENQGQTDPRVRFLSHGANYSLFLTDSEVALRLNGNGWPAKDVVKFQLIDAAPRANISGLRELPGTANYFVGNDPSKWRRHVPRYEKVRYERVYPGVDLVFYGNQQQLEYDFVIAPGADPGQAKLRIQGASKITLDNSNNLIILTKHGQIAFQKPFAYQWKNGHKQAVAGRFTLTARNTLGFSLQTYDRSRELVIDPTLAFATYLGGSGYYPPASSDCCGDTGNGIATDLAGNVYVVGTTGNTDFPVTSNAFQSENKDPHDPSGGNVFVSKLDPTGSILLYSTYLGGTGTYWYKDSGLAIAVDSSGNAYVTGFTGSSNFPVTPGAFQTTNKALGPPARNAFVTKLTADGSGLLYSTYLGGSGFNTGVSRDGDIGTGIAVDSSGNAFITGYSYSQDFPVTTGVYQASNKAYPIRQSNPFITKLNASGTALIYSTYLGGSGISQNCCYYFSGADFATGIAIDSAGDAYITGYAYSKDFPVSSNAYQANNHAHSSLNGTGAADTNAFVAKLNPTGSGLIYSTYLGGSGNPYYGDTAVGIAIDSTGYAYITGQAGSTDFPTTAGAFQQKHPGGIDEVAVFVTKLDLDGSALVYSTYVSGSGKSRNKGDVVGGIAVNNAGQAAIVGTTVSTNFPVTADAFQSTNNEYVYAPADYYSGNVFLTQLNATGTGLIYSTYFGGSGSSDGGGGDVGLAIALDSGGNAYITGHTVSNNLPVTEGAYQATNKAVAAGHPDSTNVFIAQFGIGSTAVTLTFDTAPTGLSYLVDGTTYTSEQKLSFTMGSPHTISVTSPQGSSGTQYTFTGWSDGGAPSHTITANAAATYTASFSTAYLLTTAVNPSSGGTVSPNSGNYYAPGTIVSLIATPANGYAFSNWTGSVANATSASTSVTMNAPESVTASFVSAGTTYLFGNITGKSGTTAARSWSVQVSNNGPAAALGAEITNIAFVQEGGVPCTPKITSSLPLSAGDLTPGASNTAPLGLDFTGCAGNSRFAVTVSLSANGGNASGSIVRLNQFQ